MRAVPSAAGAMDSFAFDEAQAKAISLFDMPTGVPSALIVVDVQRDWYSRDARISAAFPQIASTIPQLLQNCRETGMPVVHVRAKYDVTSATHVPFFKMLNPEKRADVSLEPEDWAKEEDGESVIHKPTFDAFFQTEMDELLKGMGVRRVYLCGLVTSACVLNTAFGAFRHGYEVVLVTDACADRTRAQHAGVIKMYINYVFVGCTAEELVLLREREWRAGVAKALLAATRSFSAEDGPRLKYHCRHHPDRDVHRPASARSSLLIGTVAPASSGSDESSDCCDCEALHREKSRSLHGVMAPS